METFSSYTGIKIFRTKSVIAFGIHLLSSRQCVRQSQAEGPSLEPVGLAGGVEGLGADLLKGIVLSEDIGGRQSYREASVQKALRYVERIIVVGLHPFVRIRCLRHASEANPRCPVARQVEIRGGVQIVDPVALPVSVVATKECPFRGAADVDVEETHRGVLHIIIASVGVHGPEIHIGGCDCKVCGVRNVEPCEIIVRVSVQQRYEKDDLPVEVCVRQRRVVATLAQEVRIPLGALLIVADGSEWIQLLYRRPLHSV